MSLLRFQKYKDLYITTRPLMTAYSTIVGIEAGITVNQLNSQDKSIDRYSTMIGYTSIGIVTGLMYPISYPLFGCYILYKKKYL